MRKDKKVIKYIKTKTSKKKKNYLMHKILNQQHLHVSNALQGKLNVALFLFTFK